MDLFLPSLTLFFTLLVSSTKCQENCTLAGDVVFVVDSSGSIGSTNFNIMREFIVKVLENLNIGQDGTRVGFVSYAHSAANRFFLNDDFVASSVIARVRNVPYTLGGTNTSGGIRVMANEQFISSRGDRADVTNFGVVITDGNSNRDSHRLAADAQEAKNRGIICFAIGITDSVNTNELMTISSAPFLQGETWWTNPDFVTVQQIAPQISNAICKQALPPINGVRLPSHGSITLIHVLPIFLVAAASSLLKT